MDSADIPFGPPPADTPPPEQIPLVVPDTPVKVRAPRCIATTKAGKPCPMQAMNKITPGYCLPHDPGLTKEMRLQFTKGYGLPGDQARASMRRHLRSADDIMAYVEELVNKWEAGPGASLTVESLDTLANLLRIQLGAIKEKNSGKKGKEKAAPAAWRDVG